MLNFFGEFLMHTFLSLCFCMLFIMACSNPEDPPTTNMSSDASIDSNTDSIDANTDSTSCPNDYQAANGTPCSQNGQSCTNCTDGCNICLFLNCEDNIWVALESFPPEDACSDAGLSDIGPDPSDTGPVDTGPDPIDTGLDLCPDDYQAAEGTSCNQSGQSCNNCSDPCTPCLILNCEEGTWVILESFPPPCTDAGLDPVDGGSTPDAGSGDFTWFTSCGDPVCHGWTEKPNIPACSDEVEGAVCALEDSSCDPHPCAINPENCDPASGCNSVLICATNDPKENGCPMSQREAKRDIHYLNDLERWELYKKLIQIPLASWRYKTQGDVAPESIGFIIEDLKESPAVQSTGERVNLYGYTTMAVAAFQIQAQQIKSLQSELETLRTELKGIRKDCAK